MYSAIQAAIETIASYSETKPIQIVSHYDTDGITAAAIFSKALQRLQKPFSLHIVKSLEAALIDTLVDDVLTVFLDLGTGALPKLKQKTATCIVFDHHDLIFNVPQNVIMVHPSIGENENVATSALCYMFAKRLSEQNKDLAHLAVIGMVGDLFNTEINKSYQEILNDAETLVKRSLLLYPATRPIDKVLENSLSIYIPSVSGSLKGVLELLKEAGIEKTTRGFKSVAELSEQEMVNLTTAIMLKCVGKVHAPANIIGNIFLIKLFNQLEDARELSALINACSRMGATDVALGVCLGSRSMKKEAEKIYTKYRKSIGAALEYIATTQLITGSNYLLINARDNIKDTIIGTVASIMSFSPLYAEGTVIVAMAYRNEDNKIKVSARLAGRKGRNVREVLASALAPLNGECDVGGHPQAAGCIIERTQEVLFMENLQKQLDVELVKV